VRRSRVVAFLTLLLVPALALALGASPASAKWLIHNSNDVTQITAPPGGTEEQTCSDRLRGETGWATFVSSTDPAPDPLPLGALGPATYELWKAPPGFTSFDQAQEDQDANGNTVYTFFDANGDPVPTTFTSFTTSNRTALSTPVSVNGVPPGDDDVYVFTTAPIDQPLSGVVPGDVLGLKPIGGSTLLNLTAVDCSQTSSYQFSGFFRPVDNPPTVNTGKAGRTYPVQFQLRTQGGALVSDLSAVKGVLVKRTSCSSFSTDPTDALEATVTGRTTLRYDTTTERFVYNWKTSKKGCYSLLVTLDSGQVFPAYFQLT
jgi:hypothetical protein